MRNAQRFSELLCLLSALLSLLLSLIPHLLAHLHTLALLLQLLHRSPQLRHDSFTLLRRVRHHRLARSVLPFYQSLSPPVSTQRLDLTRLLLDLLAQHGNVGLVTLDTTLRALLVLLLRDDVQTVRFFLLF